MVELTDLVERSFLDNTAWQWLLAGGVAVATFAAALIIRGFIRERYSRMEETRERVWLELPLEIASRTTVAFVLIVATFAGLATLEMPAGLRRVLISVLTIALFWQAGVWASTAVVAWLERKRQQTLTVDRAAVGTLGIIGFIGRALIWIVVVLLTLDNLGIDITALVAGLGIGGVAVALAVQNVLGDLLASLSIALDRPFVVGDFLIVDDFLGTVEQIGVKSVRLRSLSGEQIIMSNADLLNSRVRNYGRMFERRVLFKLGVTYETEREKLKKIPTIVRTIIESQQSTRFDRCHFFAYGAFSLDYETVYYVLSPDYNAYMDIQQAINFAIHESFEREQIEFAYPTQKLWMATVAQDQR